MVTRFGVPNYLISDNGLQFDSKAFCELCCDFDIKNKHSTPAYPQSSGQAKAINKTILNGLKKMLDGAKGRWVEELPNVLWVYQTTPRHSTGETLFSLTYGVEAVILAEVNPCNARVSEFNPTQNDLMMVKRLELLDEYREVVTIRLAEYQQNLAGRYNQDVKTRDFSAMESNGEHVRLECRKAGPYLGRAL